MNIFFLKSSIYVSDISASLTIIHLCPIYQEFIHKCVNTSLQLWNICWDKKDPDILIDSNLKVQEANVLFGKIF